MKYPIKNSLAVCGHPWDMVASQGSDATLGAKETTDKQNAIINAGISGIRIYLDVKNVKSSDNLKFGFNPTINQGGGFKFEDSILAIRAKNQNFLVSIAYQNMPDSFRALWNPTGQRSTQYRKPGTDVNSAATWNQAVADMAVLASRYGKNVAAPDYPIFVSPNWWEPAQVMLKGSGLANRIATGNEYDNGYSNNPMNGPNGGLNNPGAPALSGQQYAILWKASYDAIKKIDPNMQVSTTGVMTQDPKILIDALAYAKSQGWGDIFDVYECHIYPWGWDHGNLASALPPEMNLIPAAKALVTAAPAKKICVGEWGYDLHPDSNIGIRPFGGYTGEQIRSWWNTRAQLGFMATGIESSFYYRIYQDYGLANDTNSTQFETSSLFIKDDKNNITRRLAGDAFKQLSQLGDFVHDSTLAEDATKVVYKFVNGTKALYVGWTIEQLQPVTVNGVNRASFTEVKSNYQFPAGTKMYLQPGDTMTSQAFPGGNIELSSKPVFVLVDGTTPVPIPPNPRTQVAVLYSDGTWESSIALPK